MIFKPSAKAQQAARLSPKRDHSKLKRTTLSVVLLVSFIALSLILIRSGFDSNSDHAQIADAEAAIAPNEPLLAIDKAFIRTAITPYIERAEFPENIGVFVNEQAEQLQIEYTLDQTLQAWVQQRLQRYNPDYGAFVALDPDSGDVLAMVENHRNPGVEMPNTALQATYPAASVFKIVTAAALLEENLAQPDTTYSFSGKSTSLYKRQVERIKSSGGDRVVTLTKAFAKSINPVFGHIGAEEVGGDNLKRYAEKFGFNAAFVTDFEFDNGHIDLNIDDPWQIVESASGYTRRNTLSPMHGAVIAASVINGGDLIAPRVVQQVDNDSGQPIFIAGAPARLQSITSKTAADLQQLMEATIKVGTGRKSFRGFFDKDNESITVGGKTGSLNGLNPKGTYDWFVGYAHKGNKRIAFAMLCINQEKWYVKSSRFTREVLDQYFKEPKAVGGNG